MVGWLFRLFDRTKWLNLYPTLSCILCILAIFVFSSPNLPYRILLRNRKSTKTIHQKDQEKGELTEYLKTKESTLIEVIQAYEIYLPQSIDNATSFISAYFKETEGFLNCFPYVCYIGEERPNNKYNDEEIVRISKINTLTELYL